MADKGIRVHEVTDEELAAASPTYAEHLATDIEYEVTLRVTVPAGRPDDAPKPYEERFYAITEAREVNVLRAERITPATNYGGPR